MGLRSKPSGPPPSQPSAPSQSSTSAPAPSKPSVDESLPDVKPTNYVSVTKDLVSGAFVIDPTMKVPSWLLKPLADNEIRWNLSLTSQSDATETSEVDIYLVHGKERVEGTSANLSPPPRTMLAVRSNSQTDVSLVCATFYICPRLIRQTDLIIYGTAHTAWNGQESSFCSPGISA